MIEIIYKDKAYPCRSTLGAMLRFKQQTGRDVSEIKGISDLSVYLWCCVTSASSAEGKAFDVSLQDFLDNLSPDDMTEWAESLQVGEPTKKK